MAARTSRSRSKRIAAQREQHPQNPPRSSPSASVSSVRSPTAASVGGGTAGGATSPGADSVVSGLPESRDVTPAPTSTPTPKVGSSSELVAAGEDEEPGTPTRGRQETPKPVDSFAEVGATTQEEEGAEPLAEEHVQPAAGPEPQALVDVPEADPASVPASATADVDIEALPEEPVASASNAEARAPNGIEEHVDPSPSLPTEEPALDPADPAVDEPPEDPPATEVEPLSATVPVDTTDAPPDPAPVDSAPDPLPPASSLLVDDAAPATQPDSTERLSPAEPLEPTQELPSAFSIPASASSFPTSPPSFPDLPTTAVDPVLGRRPDFAYHDVPVGESLPFALESQQLADGGKADMGLGKEDWEVIGDEDVAEAAGADEREAGPSAEAMQDEGEGATVEGTQGEETSMNVDAEPPAVVDAALPEPPVPAAAASPVTETAQPDAAPLAVEDEAMTGIEGDAAAQPEDLPVEVGASQEEAQVVAAPEVAAPADDSALDSADVSNPDLDLFGDAIPQSEDEAASEKPALPTDVGVAENIDAAAAGTSADVEPASGPAPSASTPQDISFHTDADEQANIEAELRRLSDGGWNSPFSMRKSLSSESGSTAAVAPDPVAVSGALVNMAQRLAPEAVIDGSLPVPVEAPTSDLGPTVTSVPADAVTAPTTTDPAADDAGIEASAQGTSSGPSSAQSTTFDQKESSQTSWASPPAVESTTSPKAQETQVPAKTPFPDVTAAPSGPGSERPKTAISTASAAEMPPPLMTAAGVVVKKVLRDGEDQASGSPSAEVSAGPSEPPKSAPAPAVQIPPAPAAKASAPLPGGGTRPKAYLDPMEIRQRALEATISLGPNLSVEVLRAHLTKYGGAIVFGLLSFNQHLLKVYNATQTRTGDEVKSLHTEIEQRMEQNLGWLAAIADAEQRGIAPNLSTAKFPDLTAFKFLPREAEDQLAETQRRLMYFVECTKLLETRLGDALRRSAQQLPFPQNQAANVKRARSETVDSVGSQESAGPSKRPKPANNRRTQSPAIPPARPASRATGKPGVPPIQQPGYPNPGGQGPGRPGQPPNRAPSATPQTSNQPLAGSPYNRVTPPPGQAQQAVNGMVPNGAMSQQQQLALQQRIAASQGMPQPSLQQQVLLQQQQAQAQMGRRPTPGPGSAQSPPGSMGPPAPPSQQQQPNAAQRPLLDQYRQLLDHQRRLQTVVASSEFAQAPPDQQNHLRNQLQQMTMNVHAFQQQYQAAQQAQAQQAAMAQAGQQPQLNQADPARSATPMQAASPPQSVGTPGAYQRQGSIPSQQQSPAMAHQQINRTSSAGSGIGQGSIGGQQGQQPYGGNQVQQNYANHFAAQSQMGMGQRNELQQQLVRQQLQQLQQQQGPAAVAQALGQQAGMMGGFQGGNQQMILAALQAQQAQQQQQREQGGAGMMYPQNQGSPGQMFGGTNAGYQQLQQPQSNGGSWM